MSEKNLKTTQETDSSIKWYSYVALIVGVVFFSGIFAASKGQWYSVFDFTVLNGGFGRIADATTGKMLTST